MDVVLGSFPGYLFISTYILLAFFWYSLQAKAYTQIPVSISSVKRVYVVVNVCLYTCWFTLYGLLFGTSNTSIYATVHRVEAWFTTGVSLVAGAIFLIVGFEFYLKVRSVSYVSPERVRISRKVAILTLICTFVFLVRALIIFLSIYFETNRAVMVLCAICHAIFIELIPTWSMLFVLGSQPKEQSPQRTRVSLNEKSNLLLLGDPVIQYNNSDGQVSWKPITSIVTT